MDEYHAPAEPALAVSVGGNASGSARLGLGLTAALVAPTAGWFLFAAFSPGSLATPIGGGYTTTLWFLYGPAIIVLSMVFGLIYTLRANRAARRLGLWLAASGFGAVAMPARAASTGAASAGGNHTAILLFLALVLLTLAITFWAARRTRSADDFYAAGGRLTALQNGLAIAGDIVSAGAFLGLTGLIFASGFDGLIYAAGYAVAYPVITLLFADRMRNLGRFTFADVLSYRLAPTPIRIFAATSTLIIVIFYLVSQMVGAGQLVQLLFDLDYVYAELGVGALMLCYVLFGGMMATSWVQIVKAVLMLFAGGLMAILSLATFGFDYDAMLTQAVALHPRHAAMLAPTSFARSPISTLSLGLGMFFGSCGLPHLIMRFFTVPDARTARNSMMWGSLFIGTFFLLVFIIGVGAVALVNGHPAYVTEAGAPRGGGNMAAVHLAHALGGDLMLGFVSAVAFATILAVVAGLTLAGASAVSHDLFAHVLRRGRVDERSELVVSRIATVVLGVLAVLLGIAFRTQNIAYMIGLVVGIAASSNFPLLFLAIYWRGLTTAGAVSGGAVGLALALGLTVLGPSIWVKVLGYPQPIFAMDPPTLVAMPAAFLTCIGVSLLDRSRRAGRDRAGYQEQLVRMAGRGGAVLQPAE